MSKSVVPSPLWVLAWLELGVEFALYSLLLSRAGCLTAAATLLTLPFVVRLILVIASYPLSRWMGVKLKPGQRLGFFGWWKYILVEFWHLCMQSLVLIPFRAFFHTRTERGLGPADGPVVLFQHGFINNGAVWFFTARALESDGFRVFSIDQPVFASIDTMGDLLAKRVDEVLGITGASKLTLVAHSMGGLICRAYLRRYGDAKIERLMTMGTPHHGTFRAYMAGGMDGEQMCLGNTWLSELGKTAVTIPFTSIYSVHDTVVFPQSSSVMPEAKNIELSGVGHVSMPSGIISRKFVMEELRALNPSASSV